jgi:thiamine-phosphate pyrophosphorylase
VNDRPDIALALEAEGVHLGQDDVPPMIARSILGPVAIIGRSTHSVEDIDRAMTEHAAGLCDYIAVGPVHETPTKSGRRAVGYDLLRYAAGRVPFPWFAIGGIDPTNVADVLEAGAGRIVVVRAIAESADPVATAKQLAEALA